MGHIRENKDVFMKSLPRIRVKVLSATFIVFASLVVGFLGGIMGSRTQQLMDNNVDTTASRKVVLNESQLISQIAKDVGPSVVSIDVTSQTQRVDFFGRGQQVEQQSAGTGLIISESGYIITNRHVVDAATTDVSITLSDGTTLTDVEIVGRTAANDTLDIAFLKITDTKGKKLTVAKLADSSKVQVGDKVIAIGNALGQFQNTVTSGIISGFGRSVEAGSSSGDTEVLQNLFQTDTAINEGNSGGPLVNISGEVIGINTAVAGGSAENIGFAIPINDVQGLVKGVLTKGKVERAYIGVRYIALTDDYAYEFNLNVKRGAYIAPTSSGSPIIPNSPAEKSGLKEKDIITKVSGTTIDENNSLVSLVGRHSVGDTIDLTIIRDAKEQTVKVTLEAYKQQ